MLWNCIDYTAWLVPPSALLFSAYATNDDISSIIIIIVVRLCV